ncbi:MAG: SDR family NAD(P)-dependent oxidoreductase, partial [Oxalobacteraceae bacterium]
MPQDPRTSAPTSFPDEPHQPRPGLETQMRTKPDHGENSYVGKGLLAGMAALITGGDSGIGRAIAIAYAREGADVAISYLSDEQKDAEETKHWVEKAGRRCLLLPGDIRDPAWCRTLVEKTMEAFDRLDVLVNNAAAQTTNEDLGDNAMKASTYGVANLKRILPNIEKWTYEKGEDFDDVQT